MRSRFACLVLGGLLVPGAAFADSHFADFYGGGSGGGGGSTLGGFIVALGKTRTRPVGSTSNVFVGVLGGASVQFGSHDDGSADVTQVVWSAGPRLSLEKGPDSRNIYHAQVTFGQNLTNDGQLQKNFTTVVGGAWDYVFGALHKSGTPHPGLGMRLQADRVFNMGDNDRNDIWRLSAGLIYRVPKL